MLISTSTVANAQMGGYVPPWSMGGRERAQMQQARFRSQRVFNRHIPRTRTYYGTGGYVPPWSMGGRERAQIQLRRTMGTRYYPGSYYGRYGSKLNFGLNVLGMVIDAKQNQQALEMAKREQQVQLEIARTQRREAERQESFQIAASLKQQQSQGNAEAENERLRQENEALRLELEKAHLKAELENSKTETKK